MPDSKKIERSEEQWREQLTEEQYRVTRKAGTERPFSGEYEEHWDKGRYLCVCCEHTLFDSGSKFNAGCGWPSFSSELEEAGILHRHDNSLGMNRVELLCSECEAHLGHIFPDGPPPTGLRYCINSASLRFEPANTDAESASS